MSIKCMTAVWEHSKATGTSRLVILALADIANEAGYCWPSLTTLQKKCAAARQTVLNCLERLEQLGELYLDRKQRRGNLYVVLLGLDDQAILNTLTTHLELPAEEAQAALTTILENRNKSKNKTRKNKSKNLTRRVEKLDQTGLKIRPDPSLTVTDPPSLTAGSPEGDPAAAGEGPQALPQTGPLSLPAFKVGEQITWPRAIRGTYGQKEYLHGEVSKVTAKQVTIRVAEPDGLVIERSVQPGSLLRGHVNAPPAPEPLPVEIPDSAPEHIALIATWWNSLPEWARPYTADGKPPYTAEVKHAARLAQRHVPREAVQAYIETRYQEPFWQGKTISFKHITNHLPGWLEVNAAKLPFIDQVLRRAPTPNPECKRCGGTGSLLGKNKESVACPACIEHDAKGGGHEIAAA